jgi:uncharacterized protein (TIGR02452 family)
MDSTFSSTSSFDPDAWLSKFKALADERKTAALKDMRALITQGTIKYTTTLPSVKHVSLPYHRELPKSTVQPDPSLGETSIVVHDMDCLDLERDMRARGLNPCVLNMASSMRPGGGWLNGAGAQEESLFYRSDYARHLPKNLYPFTSDLMAIYSPSVTVFRESEAKGYAFSDEHRTVAFIAAAALRRPKLTVTNELTVIDYKITKDKIRQVLRVAHHHEHDSIVLSAWGCGAYGNPPHSVAHAFKEVLCDEGLKDLFKAVEFAVFDDHNSKGNHATFAEVFQVL